MNKTELIQKLKQLEGLTTEERSALIELVNTKKKYGLVWEDKPEDVEELLRQNLPVLREVKEKYIEAQPMPISEDLFNNEDSQDKQSSNISPNHILIEGDNLHALTALGFTHKGKIDVIYIDPPYNTGKPKEFKYNDKYVDELDSYRNSKWLSFMDKRLRIAKNLLKENGVIFINIDDHEVSQLNLLCNEIFNNNQNPKNSNQLGILVWDLGTGTSAGHFTRTHEYVLVYANDKSKIPNFSGGDGIIDDRAQKKIGIKNPESEFLFKAGTKFEAENGFELKDVWGGTETTRLIKGRMICKDGKLKEDVVLSAGWTQRNQMVSFFEGKTTIDSKGQNIIEFYFRENGKIYCRKDRSKINPPSVLRDIATTKQGTSILKNIFNGEEPIQFVKPIQLIQHFLYLFSNNITILDFFAGSGTTLHATMALNAEDGGNRQCILVTNNENNICEEVTYERNKRVIQGYTNAKGVAVAGLTNNHLRYYKSEFVPSTKNETNRRLLTNASTELLCIRENCYTDITKQAAFKPSECKVFQNDLGKYMVVIYHSRNFPIVCEQVSQWVIENFTLPLEDKVRLYCFSPEKDSLAEDFADIEDYIEAVPLPDAIYNAFRATFKTLKLDRKHIELNPNDAETPTTLFDDQTDEA
jgi:adenine-specific DNA-methyltransferase